MKPRVLLALVLMYGLICQSKFSRPDIVRVPLGRIIENLNRDILKKPDDLNTMLSLARVYAEAYSRRSSLDSRYKGNKSRVIHDDIYKEYDEYDGVSIDLNEIIEGNLDSHSIRSGAQGIDKPSRLFFPVGVLKNENIEIEERKFYEFWKETKESRIILANNFLLKAKELYSIVNEKRKNDYLAMLGLGWVHLELKEKVLAIGYFRKLIELDKNSKPTAIDVYLENQPPLSTIAKEAAYYLSGELDPKVNSEELANLLKTYPFVDQSLVSTKKTKSTRLITPLIFPIHPIASSYKKLISPNRFIPFDLDGSGDKKPWRWIKPNAAWLVYFDGRPITSGLSMFGNVTFWSFWSNGFEALKSLDDNGDGVISGGELDQIWSWNDKNENGISEGDELVPLSKLGVIGINLNYVVGNDGILFCKDGLRFKDGSIRPIYDFISDLHRP